jgi:hypothetical protein
MKECPLCHDVGWIIECNPTRMPLNVELIPCLIPDCKKSGRKIEIMDVHMLGLSNVATHPISRIVMSVSR